MATVKQNRQAFFDAAGVRLFSTVGMRQHTKRGWVDEQNRRPVVYGEWFEVGQTEHHRAIIIETKQADAAMVEIMACRQYAGGTLLLPEGITLNGNRVILIMQDADRMRVYDRLILNWMGE